MEAQLIPVAPQPSKPAQAPRASQAPQAPQPSQSKHPQAPQPPLREVCLRFLKSCGFQNLTIAQIQKIKFVYIKQLWLQKKNTIWTEEEKEYLRPLTTKFLMYLISKKKKANPPNPLAPRPPMAPESPSAPQPPKAQQPNRAPQLPLASTPSRQSF